MKNNRKSADLIGATSSMIMEIMSSLTVDKDLPAFSHTSEAMTFTGTTATVQLDLMNASVRIFCRGQQNSVYDSHQPDQCLDIEFADQLGMEAVSEMIKASSAQSEREKSRVMAKIAKRPW